MRKAAGKQIMTKIDQSIVREKYNEVSRLETLVERRKFLGQQSEEMRAALWLENINRKTEGMNLSAEQKEIIEVIKKKFVTVEFARQVRGKTEDEAGPEYQKIMSEANELLGRDNLRELFAVLGDSSRLKKVC